jgi:hypothetical protein
MLEQLDIFQKTAEGQPIWVKAVEGIDAARRYLFSLPASSRDEYFVFDVRANKTVPIFPSQDFDA